jgi:hypothetical protein
MALRKRTWLWIIAGVFGFGVICVIAVAGMGVYYVSKYVDATKSTTADAARTFEAVRTKYKEPPLLEMDRDERVHVRKRIVELPTSKVKAEHLWILVWEPGDERLVKMSMPFWLLRIGKRKIDFANSDQSIDLDRLELDMEQLERIGPVLLLDHKVPSGQRVLIWTQ